MIKYKTINFISNSTHTKKRTVIAYGSTETHIVTVSLCPSNAHRSGEVLLKRASLNGFSPAECPEAGDVDSRMLGGSYLAE